MEISQKIADLFDGMRVDKGEDGSFYDILYNSKFDLTNFETIRLSNTSDYIWSKLTFEVTTSYGSRGWFYEVIQRLYYFGNSTK